MKKYSLSQLIKSNDIQDIEKHLAYSFVKAHSLNISKNKFLQEYFKDFVIGENLFAQIQQLNHNSIEDISIDMELLIPSEDKKVNGAFFTPSYIVDYILEGISPSPDAKILDPSCDMNPKSWTKNFRGFLCKKLRRGKNKQMQIVYDICI